MKIDRKVERALLEVFPNSILEISYGELWIRTQAWMIEASDLLVLKIHGLNVRATMIEGDCLTLIMTQKSTKNILKK